MMLLESDWLCHHSDTQHRMLSIVTRHNCPSVSFSPVRLLLQFSDLSLQECMNDDVSDKDCGARRLIYPVVPFLKVAFTKDLRLIPCKEQGHSPLIFFLYDI